MIVSLAEETVLASSLVPAADAGGRTGLYVNLKNCTGYAFISYYISQGNAATILLAPVQGIGVAGGSSKAIPAVPIWLCNDAATSSAFVRQTDAVSYTTDATVKSKIVVFQIDPSKLDVLNLFNAVAAVTGASNAANITSAFVVTNARYGQATGVNAQAN